MNNKINTNNNSTKLKLGIIITIAVISSIGYSVQSVSAYEIDTHYHWTLYLALYVGFDWNEAHLIASGNQRMDETKLVAGWINKGYVFKSYPNNFDWHALSYDSDAKDNRLSNLKERAYYEENDNLKLVKFGQYLHYLQDVEPHDTYGSVHGHAFAGHKPDSPGNDKAKFRLTTVNTLSSLNDLLVHLNRQSKVVDMDIIDPIIDTINSNSKPGFTFNSGQTKNKVTIEKSILALSVIDETFTIPLDTKYHGDRPINPKVIKGKFITSDADERGDPIANTWNLNQHHLRALNVSVQPYDEDSNTIGSLQDTGKSNQASISMLTNNGDTISEFDLGDKGWSIVAKGDNSDAEESNDLILMKYDIDTWTDVIRADFDTGNIGFENAIQAADIIESTSGGFKFPDGTVQSTSALPDSGDAFTAVPIGTVLDWWCVFDCTLPNGYALADGSIVDDSESQFDGQILPDLRDKFVRGVSTVTDIGEIGGTTSHMHTSDVTTDIVSAGDHNHTVDPSNVSTSSTGDHNHTTDPVATVTTSTGVHNHTTDPPNTGTSSIGHNHKWSNFDSSNDWNSFTSGGGTTEVIAWANGIDGEGTGVFPLGVNVEEVKDFYTDNVSHFHNVDIASTTSSTNGEHLHSVDIASTTSSTHGDHLHNVDIASTTSSTHSAHLHDASSSALIDTTSHEPPYVGLIKIIRIK